MKPMLYCIKSDFYKLIHSKILYLHILIPILGIVVFCGYYSYSILDENNKVLIFSQVVSIAFPFLIALIITMLYEEEVNAGNFQLILSTPYSNIISHLSKILTMAILGSISSLCTILGFGIVFRSMGYVHYSLTMYVQLSCLIFISNFLLYFIQYIIAFTFGNGCSLGFGIIGLLLSALLSLGLGNLIWRFIPFGWGIRISSYYLYQKMGIVVHMNMKEKILNYITIFVIAIVIILGFIIWGHVWQGLKHKSE